MLSVSYPKGPEDEALLEDLNHNYGTMLQDSVNAENKMIKLPLPADFEHGAGNARMASTFIQLNWLFFRSWRESHLSLAKILQTVIVAFFMMPVFAGLGKLSNLADINGPGAFDLAGAIFFTIVLQMFLTFLPTVIVFQREKPMFVRERDSGLYHTWIYATTKLLAEMPIMLFVPMLLNLLLYFVVGYVDKFTVFMKFYLTLALMVQATSALGYFLSSVFNQETTAIAFASIIYWPLIILGGYMISLRGIF